MHAILITCIIPLLLALINIGSTAALINILSFTVSCWLVVASVPLALLLWRRTTGGIGQKHHGNFPSTSWEKAPEEQPLNWGPWRIPEPFGTIVNVFGLAWIIIAFFFSFWPAEVPTTPKTMNFSCLMTGFWVLFGMVYYFAWGKKVGD